MTVVLDERKASLGLAYTHMTIPVAPGPFTLVYPQWIPGDTLRAAAHGVTELRVTAGGSPLAGNATRSNVRLPPRHTSGRKEHQC